MESILARVRINLEPLVSTNRVAEVGEVSALAMGAMALMILNPEPGDRVQVWYAARSRRQMPLHGKVGEVVISCTGSPRNHGVLVDGEPILRAIPCGNLREPRDESWQDDLFR